jgi:hypothetical protein
VPTSFTTEATEFQLEQSGDGDGLASRRSRTDTANVLAKKQGGRKLYELARRGEEVERRRFELQLVNSN